MSDADSDNEPTMEEILASIRRIISDEDGGEEADDNALAMEADDEPVTAEMIQQHLGATASSIRRAPSHKTSRV